MRIFITFGEIITWLNYKKFSLTNLYSANLCNKDRITGNIVENLKNEFIIGTARKSQIA
jgi:hypothetical protein